MLLLKNNKDITQVNFQQILDYTSKQDLNIVNLTSDNIENIKPILGSLATCLACNKQAERILGYYIENHLADYDQHPNTLGLHYIHQYIDVNGYYIRIVEYCIIPFTEADIKELNIGTKERLHLPKFIHFDTSKYKHYDKQLNKLLINRSYKMSDLLKENNIELIKIKIGKLRLDKTDTLVIMPNNDDSYSDFQVKELHESLQPIYPDNKILIFNQNVDLSIIKEN